MGVSETVRHDAGGIDEERLALLRCSRRPRVVLRDAARRYQIQHDLGIALRRARDRLHDHPIRGHGSTHRACLARPRCKNLADWRQLT
jgi:hypothetical protein